MKCPRCHAENWDTDKHCSACGSSLTPTEQQSTPPPYAAQQSQHQSRGNYQRGGYQQKTQIQDKLNPLIGILAFFMPLIGFILYFVWKDEKPQSAKTVGLIALCTFGLTMLFYACVGCAAMADY